MTLASCIFYVGQRQSNSLNFNQSIECLAFLTLCIHVLNTFLCAEHPELKVTMLSVGANVSSDFQCPTLI